jgi:hypothetical protein
MGNSVGGLKEYTLEATNFGASTVDTSNPFAEPAIEGPFNPFTDL